MRLGQIGRLSFRTGGALALSLFGGATVFAEEREDNAVELDASYTVDVLTNMGGGLRRETRLLGMLALGADIDGAELGAAGVTGRIEWQLLHGRAFSADVVGDAQTVSNIEAPAGARPLEAWIGYSLSENAVIRAGLVDLNGQFDVQNVGALFINSSHGIGHDFSQSGENGPSIFPTTATALTSEIASGPWRVRAGLFNAVAGDPVRPRRTVISFPGRDGLLLVGEVERVVDGTRVYAGTWHYTRRSKRLGSEGEGRRNGGGYAAIEQRLAGSRSGATLEAWLRAGVVNPRFNPIGTYVGGGLAFGTKDTRFGVAIAHARLGRPARRLATDALGPANRAESNIEATSYVKLNGRIALQPDIQYIVNPGWVRRRKDALVVGVRIHLTLF